VIKLIETPAGYRPVRSVVDPFGGGAGPTAINETASQVQAQLLESFGLSQLLTLQPS